MPKLTKHTTVRFTAAELVPILNILDETIAEYLSVADRRNATVVQQLRDKLKKAYDRLAKEG